MHLSVVIPAWNASSTLPLVLESLLRQDRSDFEVLVVDDASTDDTAAVAHRFESRLNLTLHRSPDNLGRACARNRGVELSTGEVVLLLDSDFEVVPGYVSAHRTLHERQERAVGIGVLRYPAYLAHHALARYYRTRGGAKLPPGQPLPGKYFISCLASFRRTDFEAAGQFEPRFHVWGGEDLELGLRLEKIGCRFEYLPGAVGYHHHLRSLKTAMATQESYGREGLPLILEQHPEFMADLYLEDLTGPATRPPPAFVRRLLTSEILHRPLLEIAALLEKGRLPSPLLTYLHYCAYRKGYIRYKRGLSR
ncbi:MAG: glycosyltransferase [Candidatus Zixiibacteriota bacterium]|nr:MAG: glycosyltransferase [candidate division Zixibacteria bacterium]